jgi:hypothetical protein
MAIGIIKLFGAYIFIFEINQMDSHRRKTQTKLNARSNRNAERRSTMKKNNFRQSNNYKTRMKYEEG